MKILFVCTGNICRSPAAEAVMRKMCADAGLDWRIDSAGTGGWHAGESPDRRARQAAAARGYKMDGIYARAVCAADFSEFDRIYAMTGEHLNFLREAAPKDTAAELHLFMETAAGGDGDVPDPYYGGGQGFELMMDMLEQRCAQLVREAAA